MLDLHTHTKHSDGTWTTEELLQEAEKAKLDYVSITDHNSVGAYYDIQNVNVSEVYSGKIIPGCEFSCSFNNARIELLGYNINIDIANEWIKKTYIDEEYSFEEEFNILINLCKKHNIKTSKNLKYSKEEKYPYDILYKDLLKYPENKKHFTSNQLATANNFFRSASCNIDNPLHINFNNGKPSAKELSEFIRSMGGKVFIAHIFVYNFDNTLYILDSLIENNIIDGIEVYHTDHTEKQVKTLLDICKNRNLLISGGSDCHGKKRIERKIGKSSNGRCIQNSCITWM